MPIFFPISGGGSGGILLNTPSFETIFSRENNINVPFASDIVLSDAPANAIGILIYCECSISGNASGTINLSSVNFRSEFSPIAAQTITLAGSVNPTSPPPQTTAILDNLFVPINGPESIIQLSSNITSTSSNGLLLLNAVSYITVE